MENTINIVHEVTSLRKRISYHLQIYIGCISFFGLFFLINNKNASDFLLFISIFILLFGILIGNKIFKNRLYLTDFCSNTNTVKIVYFNYSKEEILETKMEKVEIEIVNTSSRTGFNCELKLKIENLKFVVNNDFDWSLTEMKQLFEYIRFHQKIKLTEREKSMLSNLEQKVKKVPF